MTNAERETHLNQTGDNHSTWEVFTDDPYWQCRLDKVTTPVKVVGEGRYYKLDKGQITIRKKRQLSETQRRKLRENAQRLQNSSNNGSSETQNGR